jgi:hypothetical protein
MATRYGLVLIAALALTSLACGDDGTKTYAGTSRVNLAGRAVALESGDGEERVFVVGNGVEWRGMDESWRDDGTAECLPPGSEGAEVVLRTVEVDGRDRVVQIECKSLPTALVWAGEIGASPFAGYCEAIAGGQGHPAVVEQDPCEVP